MNNSFKKILIGVILGFNQIAFAVDNEVPLPPEEETDQALNTLTALTLEFEPTALEAAFFLEEHHMHLFNRLIITEELNVHELLADQNWNTIQRYFARFQLFDNQAAPLMGAIGDENTPDALGLTLDFILEAYRELGGLMQRFEQAWQGIPQFLQREYQENMAIRIRSIDLRGC